MDKKEVCDGCGKEYWPNQRWLHEKCHKGIGGSKQGVGEQQEVSPQAIVSGIKRDGEGAGRKQRWSREAYNAYQREYMRKRRLESRKS